MRGGVCVSVNFAWGEGLPVGMSMCKCGPCVCASMSDSHMYVSISLYIAAGVCTGRHVCRYV